MARNVISGNDNDGIIISDGAIPGTGTTGTVIEGNFIGVGVDGVTALGNGTNGVRITTESGHMIGGTSAGAGNIIAYNSETACSCKIARRSMSASSAIQFTRTRGKESIWQAMASRSTTEVDADTGANNLQNFAELTSAGTDGTGNVAVAGSLNTTANTTVRLEFFGTDVAAAGNGEGQAYLGSTVVITNGSGDAQFVASFDEVLAAGQYITSTATVMNPGGTYGSTSEFSANVQATSALIVDTTADIVDGTTTSVAALLASKGADGFVSLREAIMATNNTAGTETIFVTAGTYTLSIAGGGENAAATGDLDITDDLTIIGAGAGSTIIDGNSLDRVFEIHSGNVSFAEFTVQNGRLTSGVTHGAGISVASGAKLSIDTVDVQGNQVTGASSNGGGISNAGTLYVMDASISNNSATSLGGGLRNIGAATVVNSLISANSASNGGGINHTGTDPLNLTNVTISANTSSGNGGGIYSDSTVHAMSITVTDNESTGFSGGGVRVSAGTFRVANSIIAGNRAGTTFVDFYGAAVSSGYNIVGDTTGSTGFGGTDQIADPQLGGLADNGGPTHTHALLAGSTAIDNGDSSLAPAIDQRGVARGATADIGAYEFRTNVSPGISSNGGGATANISVVENTTAVTTVTATDADLDTLTYSLDPASDDDGFFTIDSGTGILTFIAAPDFETPADLDGDNVYEVTVKVADGYGGVDTQDISVTVTEPTNVLIVDTTSDVADGNTSSIAALKANMGADGYISLREAIIASNNTANLDGITPDEIWFEISAPLIGGVQTINVGASGLPGITEALIIDGTTEPNFAGTPIIELNGGNLGTLVNGLYLDSGSDGSTVQGLIINRFTGTGIEINGANNQTIQGNWVGLDATGTLASANGVNGIYALNSTGHLIGGTTAAERNVISGNTERGIYFDNTDNSTIAGNYIGTDVAGTGDVNGTASDVKNSGIYLANGSSGNTVGGTTAGAGNVISGNNHFGFEVLGATSQNNLLQGNYIGTTASGLAALGNRNGGVSFWGSGSGNIVGGGAAGAGNVISGNLSEGVYVGNASTGAKVQGNYIGVGADGLTPLGNGDAGVYVFGGSTNTLIGTDANGTNDAAERNIISGNTYGVYIRDSGTNGTIIAGNIIGLAADGDTIVANSSYGVAVTSTAGATTIGGATAVSRNVISGNAGSGVYFASSTSGSSVLNNYIGTNAAGTMPLGNSLDGIWLESSNNTISGNVVAGSGDSGIEVGNGATGNVVQGNYVGTDETATLDLGNAGSGIVLFGSGTANNRIGGTGAGEGNVVAHSGNDGIYVNFNVGAGNAILGNSVFDSGGLGIELTENGPTWGVTPNDNGDADTGPNDLQNFPVLSSAFTSGSTLTVDGTLNSGASTTYRIEFFASGTADASGHGEAERFLGATTVVTNGSGNATFSAPLAANVAVGEFITATATVDLGGGNYGSTSELGLNVAAADLHYRQLAVWGESGSTVPQFNTFDNGNFGTEGSTTNLGSWRIIQGAKAPTRDEAIVLGVDTGGQIDGQIWNGITWSALPINPLGTVSQSYWWGMDVAYEAGSGDAIVVWTDGANLEYAVWNGTSWSAVNTIGVYSGATPRQLQLAASPTADEMVLVVSDANSHDRAYVWDGDSWGNGVTLATNAGDDRTDINVVYEQQSGHAMVVYSDQTNNDLRYQLWDGANWSGQNTLTDPGATGAARWTSIAADPGSDRIAVGVVTFSNEAWFAVWDGSGWGQQTLAEMTTQGSTFPNAAVAFEGHSGDLLVTYAESGKDDLRYQTWSDTGGWSGELKTPDRFGNNLNSMTLTADRFSNQIMLALQDDASNLNYVLWNGSGWGTPSEQEVNTGETKNQPFLFLWNEHQATTTVLNSVQDTYIKLMETGNNFGASSSLIVDRESTDLQRALLQFDVSSIPVGATIYGATLNLEATTVGGLLTVDVYQVLEGWAEGAAVGTADEANWTLRDAGLSWSTAGGAFDPSAVSSLTTDTAGQHSWDITTLVQAWVDGTDANYGLMVASPDGGGDRSITYDSREGMIAPELIIHYHLANSAPVLDNSGTMALTTINEDQTANAGNTVAAILATAGGDRITDADAGAVEGIAITSLNSGNGRWEYSTNGGANWTAVGTVSDTSALLLRGTDLVRFVPDTLNATTADFTFRAWDQTTGTFGTKVDASNVGGVTAFSLASESASISVTDVNDAPAIDPSGLMDLPNVLKNSTDPSGSSVAAILASAGGDRMKDVDLGAVDGIAVTAVDDTQGTWEYSVDGGANWTAFGAVSNGSAVVLTATPADRVRFVPGTDYVGNASFDFRGWDASDGNPSGTGGVNTGSGGGSSAFSVDIENVAIVVEPTEIFFWYSTASDVGPTGGSGGGPASGTPGLANWSAGEIVGFGDPNMTFGLDATDGTFLSITDLDAFAAATTTST